MPLPSITEETPTAPLHVSVKEAAAILGLSRNQTYRLLDQGSIESRYVGTRRLVVLDSLHSFARSLPTERV